MASFNIDFTDPNNINSLNPSNQVAAPLTGGFNSPVAPAGLPNGLPSNQVMDFRSGTPSRNIIHWLVPEFGIVQMYINPNNIVYRHQKLIGSDRTKGGYTLQYWGEQLSTLALTGTTASAGIEGINVLYEVYRAEQLAFDVVGLSLAADNASLGAANQIIGGIGDAVGSAIGTAVGGGSNFGGSVGGLLGAGIAQGIFGTDNFTSLAPRNITSLATLAFGVEMYYDGWIYRGFFTDMTVTESAQNLGTIEYAINFTATQRRGYRLNSLPWQRSAVNGPSNTDDSGGTPMSFYNLASGYSGQ
jgi:hypothetical protein